jgi:hypothetical protein
VQTSETLQPYAEWADEYRAAIAGDPDRLASAERLEKYRGHVFEPSELEHPRTVFTEAELGWFQSPYDLRYIRPWVNAIDVWTGALPLEAGMLPLPELPVQTPDEILTGATESFDPVVEHLAYRGLKTLVVGQSKAGKSFTTWAKCAEAVHAGRRVLYLSEEPRATIQDKLRTFGLTDAGDRFLVVRRSDDHLRDKNWDAVAVLVENTVRNRGVDLVVVDTARPWFGLRGDESNSADVIGRAFDVLSRTCDADTAIVVLHQAPWDKSRARNSTEFHASVDLIFAVKGEGTAPRRILYLGGRVEDGIPDEQTLRWAGDHAESIGKVGRKDSADVIDRVLKSLEKDSRSLTAGEIADELEVHVRTIQRVLVKLKDQNKVIREPGAHGGTAGGQAPDRWSRAGGYLRLLERE